MKKSIIAMAVAGALAVPAIASADATLYGSFRMAMEKAKESSMELGDYGSRIGLRGTVDLGLEGTQGIYNWEQGINLNEGSTAAGRYGWIGATGAWGTALGGKADHAHYSWVESYTDVFRTGMGNEDLYIGNFAHKRIGSSLAYVSPEISGFQGFVGGVFGGDASYNSALQGEVARRARDEAFTSAEFAALDPSERALFNRINSEIAGAATADRGKDKAVDAYNLGLKYEGHGLYAAASYGSAKTAKFGDDYAIDMRTWGLAAGYQIDALSLRANYTQIKDKTGDIVSIAFDDNNKMKQYSLAAAYDLGDTQFAIRHTVNRLTGTNNPKSTQAEVSQRMGRGMVFANYIDYNSAATTASQQDTFAVGYRLDF